MCDTVALNICLDCMHYKSKHFVGTQVNQDGGRSKPVANVNLKLKFIAFSIILADLNSIKNVLKNDFWALSIATYQK